jgi:beta-mannanase
MAWLAPYPAGLGALAKANGATLYLNLEPWNTWGGKANPGMADIAAGQYDQWLTGLGQAVKAGNNPVWFTFAHEMNGNGWYPWQQSGGVSPAQWIAAWEHVVTTVKAAAGGLASFVWCPNNADVGPVAPYWPGPAFCDVAAADMYLNTASASQTYAEFAKQTVDQIGKLDGIGALAGQVWNAETGVAGTSGSRSARIAQYVRDMRADGRLRGFAWWNEGSYLLQPAELSALTTAVNAWNAA